MPGGAGSSAPDSERSWADSATDLVDSPTIRPNADPVHYAIFTPAVSSTDSVDQHSSDGEGAPAPSTPARGPI
eukprot:2452836-Heterocapsa_arctica.AAC.1